ncbi:MAG: hypothetical protein QM703_01265 [Gemmatales bacterium]
MVSSQGRKPLEDNEEYEEPWRGDGDDNHITIAPPGLYHFHHAIRWLTPPATNQRPYRG